MRLWCECGQCEYGSHNPEQALGFRIPSPLWALWRWHRLPALSVLLHFTSHGQRSLGRCAGGFNSCFSKQEPWGKTFTLLRPVTIVLRWSESCRGKIWSDTVSVRTAETPFSSSKCLVLCSLVENYVLITIILEHFLPLVPINCVSPLSPRSPSFLVHEPPGSFLFLQARTPWRCLCNGFV